MLRERPQRIAAIRRAASTARAVLPGRDTPMTVVVVIVIGLALARGTPGDADVMQWASSNLTNLHQRPVTAMLASIFVAAGGGLSPSTLLVAMAGSVLERRVGALRTAVIALLGHIVATLITEGAVHLAIWAHTDSRSAAGQLDIGISYVAFTVAASACRFLPTRWRALALATLLLRVSAPLAIAPGMTNWGHLLSVLIGLTAWNWLPTSAPASAAQGRASRGARCLRQGRAAAWSRAASAICLATLATLGSIWVSYGAILPPRTPALTTLTGPAHHHPHRPPPHSGRRPIAGADRRLQPLPAVSLYDPTGRPPNP